ncbi:MAG: aminoacyl-histidine dipeptidase [Lachnospiraceae bacterium]|nr:aminoacyl-histidine dipeptidase [Lachnospiraceae bacterium]
MSNKVFNYFEKLSSIPRGSGNTKSVSDYCVEFAKEHNLEFYQDDMNNVIIWKDASKGRENEEPVIIQGHLDMVAEKTNDSNHDFEKDGLELVYEGDYIYAKDTTLGGDDGIAIAYALAILDDDTLSHPPIEAVFTTDEEIGLLGAAKLDMNKLKGTRLLNIDSEEEGIILVSCAGGMTSESNIPFEAENVEGIKISLVLTGLKGGHSGVEIGKERGNAVILMGRILSEVKNEVGINVINIKGGLKDNAIPRECKCELVCSDYKKLVECVEKINNILKNEYISSDKDINLILTEEDEYTGKAMSSDSLNKVCMYLSAVPNGIQNMSMDIEGLVETSLNLGIFNADYNGLKASFSVRSSVASRKIELGRKIKLITEYLGGNYNMYGEYPSWQYKKESPLRDLMIDIYKKMYDKELVVEAIHAGLECGYFVMGKPELDVVSFGPNIFNIHTTEEKMSISSVNRTYDYLIEILKEM